MMFDFLSLVFIDLILQDLSCNICDQTFASEKTKSRHMQSKKHAQAVEDWEQTQLALKSLYVKIRLKSSLNSGRSIGDSEISEEDTRIYSSLDGVLSLI